MFALRTGPDYIEARVEKIQLCQKRVDGWRRHVLISCCAEATQPSSSSSSTLCQLGCCQGLSVNESRQPGEKYKHIHLWMTDIFFIQIYIHTLMMIYYLFCIMC